MVSTLVFDLGGVLMNHDHTRLRPYLSRMPRTAIDPYARGLCTTADFLHAVHESIPELSESEIAELWTSLHGGIPAERLEDLRRWRKEYPCFLLSNNDELHWQHVLELVPDFEQYFDGIALSQVLHMHKPEPEIYEATDRMIADWHRSHGIPYDRHETLFIDDLPANTAAAAAYGWQTLNHYEEIDLFLSKKIKKK